MARIELTQGMFTLIDDADVAKVEGHSWYLSSNGYAVSHPSGGGKIRMHRLLSGCRKGKDVDHRNGDRLDNRRRNLRVCSRSVNRRNAAKGWPVVSKFRGVYRRFISDKWFVLAPGPNHRQVYCGDYVDEVEAARAYDSAVTFLHPGAKTNFADPVPRNPREILITNGQCEPGISRYRGVSSSGGNKSKSEKYRTKFCASIYAGRVYKLGHFDTELEAAQVYDAACVLLGVRGRMNFPNAVPGVNAIDTARRAIFPLPERLSA